jgi:hypothetical protein
LPYANRAQSRFSPHSFHSIWLSEELDFPRCFSHVGK